MSNFDFLEINKLFRSFAKASIEAERGLETNPVTCIMLSRKALELGVKWLYANDKLLLMPYQTTLSALTHTITFKNIVDDEVRKGIDFVIKKGNFVVHTNTNVTRDEAILVLKCLFNFMKWIYFNYDPNYKEIEFDTNKLPQESNDNIKKDEREKLEKELDEQTKKLETTLKENEELRKQLTEERENKNKSKNFVVKDLSEFQTRKQFIDLDLQIAGWDFNENITEELEVQGMKNTEGIGYVDYVLFGKNGLPLAVVEAKRSSKNAHEGKQQASIYADCLEEKYGQRPVIYYTNGIEIYFWDNLDYPERKVEGFHTQDELQRLINRRKSKQSLEHIYIDSNITNRPYQLEAIKRVCEAFENKHRKALLVMATGTGKTRTAISLVDVLTGKGWVQNVLFLADRTELIKQAKKNFVKLLPDMSCCNLLDSKDNPEDSRIVFSTYQTMINAIDNMRNKDGKRLFTPGHFDLIIIDEAHRSIYKKYQSIFEYFDGLLVGLTATPRSDVDRNTYSFFELENNVPTFAYEYQEAIKYIPSHRILAINRGEKEDFLKVKLEKPEEKILNNIEKDIIKGETQFTNMLKETILDSFKRLIEPSIDREIRSDLTEKAEEKAIKVFGQNSKQLLLGAPIKGKTVMGFDPAYRTGCKIAVIDETGKVLDYTTVYPTAPQNDVEGAKKELLKLIEKDKIDMIAIGNGTASRESEMFVADMIKEANREVCYVIVSEAGASVYSASKLATEEYPDINVSIRGAISIARRLQDPLAELVKIDPKAIGVGQYQHDVNQKNLEQSLTGVVEDAVNSVGVDINTATPSLLAYVSGINNGIAKNIVKYREENGKLKERKELLKVPKLGKVAYEQCAGFIRVPDGKNPLEITGVHPESYSVAENLLSRIGYKLNDLTNKEKFVEIKSELAELNNSKNIKELAVELNVGEPTSQDIINELMKPGRDPREEMPKPILRADVLKFEDLRDGMILTGTVRNVTDFGAFVDVGVKHDGLVHISEMSENYVKNPSDVVSVGDVVKVQVIGIDQERQKVKLSMKIK